LLTKNNPKRTVFGHRLLEQTCQFLYNPIAFKRIFMAVGSGGIEPADGLHAENQGA